MKRNMMKENINDIKKRAREIIMKCWAELAIICLLNSGIAVINYSLVIIIGILTGAHGGDTILPIFIDTPPLFFVLMSAVVIMSYLITAPLHYGIKWYLWQISSGNYMPMSSIFAGYATKESQARFIRMRLKTDVRRMVYTIPALIVIITGIVITHKVGSENQSAVIRIMFYTGCVIIVMGTVMIWGVMNMRYLPTPFIAAVNADLEFTEIITYSDNLVKKRRTFLLAFYSSFYVWYIFSLMLFPLMFLIPYIDTSTAIFVRDIITNYYNGTDEEEKQREDETIAV